MKTPDYVLSEDFSYPHGVYDIKTLPAGTFVRPVEWEYLPKHIKDDERYIPFNKITHVFCYSRYGFIPVVRNLIRRV